MLTKEYDKAKGLLRHGIRDLPETEQTREMVRRGLMDIINNTVVTKDNESYLRNVMLILEKWNNPMDTN